MRKSLFIAASLLLLHSTLFAFFSKEKAVVFPFTAEENATRHPWLGLAISELLSQDLQATRRYEVLGISDLQKEKERGLRYADLKQLDPARAKTIAAEREIGTYITGSYREKEEAVTIDIAWNREGTLHTRRVELPLADLVSSLSYAFGSFLASQGETGDSDLDAFYDNDPNSLVTLGYYTRGLEALYSYVDTTLKAQASVDDFNTNKKAQLQKRLAQMKAGGSFDLAAFGELMMQLQQEAETVAKDAGKTLDRDYLYEGTHAFREAVAGDGAFGPGYARLAEILFETTKRTAFGGPPKSYLQDICAQAEKAKVPAACSEEVDAYEAPSRGGGSDNSCYGAQEDFNTFKALLEHPTGAYNYGFFLEQSFGRIGDLLECLDKTSMAQTLETGLQALQKQYAGRKTQSLVKFEYEIAWIYLQYEMQPSAKAIYLSILEQLKSPAKPEKKALIREDEISDVLRAKVQQALQQQVEAVSGKPGAEALSAPTAFEEKYAMKSYQKLATIYADEHNASEAKRYLGLLERFPYGQLNENVDMIKISQAYYALGECGAALRQAERVLAEKERDDMGPMGRQGPFIDLYLYMAELYECNNDPEKAIAYADKAAAKLSNIRGMLFTDKEKVLQALAAYDARLEAIRLAVALRRNDPNAYAELYSRIADNKARKLYSHNAIRSMLSSQINRSLKPLLVTIKTDRKKLLSLDEQRDKTACDALRAAIAQKQSRLAFMEKINNVVDRKNFLRAQNLYSALPPDTAVLDFFRTGGKYYMFIIRNGAITLRDLGEKEAIEQEITQERFVQSDTLYRRIFAKGVPEAKRLVIIPDGLLYLLPFEALKTPEGFLIKQKSISYLPSVLMLDKGRGNTPVGRIALFANPDYEQELQSAGLQKERTLRDAHFTALPGTMLEAKKIEKIAAKSQVDLKLYTAKEASETNFEQQTQSDILHIATHGYVIDTAEGYRGTGIVLSGANRSIRNGVDGGIISAQKILDLYDFSQTGLVVLSACDTGAGKLSAVEGVQSLGSAFMMVGASNVLMNLWEIPDIETSYLMKHFYDNLLVGKLDKSEALRQAKLAMLRRGASYRAWASLVLFGH